MNLLGIGRTVRLYMNEANLPNRFRQKHVDQEIYYRDAKVINKQPSFIGDHLTLSVDRDMVTVYAHQVIPLVYLIMLSGKPLSAHYNVEDAVLKIQQIERISREKFTLVIDAIASDLRYETHNSTYIIHPMEIS